MITNAAKKLLLGASDGIETSIGELITALNIESLDPLDQAVRIEEFLIECELQLSPALRQSMGDFSLPRILRANERPVTVDYEDEINALESETLERKSSLFFDYKKYQQNNELDPKNYKAEHCVHSVMKTIAGFLNSSGGVLFIGVADDSTILGLDPDLQYTKESSLDSWQLSLQSLIKTRFKDGITALNYCSITMVEVGGKVVCRVHVVPKHELSFVTKDGKYALYVRQGNETNEIGIEEVPSLVLARQKR